MNVGAVGSHHELKMGCCQGLLGGLKMKMCVGGKHIKKRKKSVVMSEVVDGLKNIYI